MIFQSLIALYGRLEEDEEYIVPTFGFSCKEIGFCITIDKHGNLIGQPEDLRTKNKQKYDFRASIAPFSNTIDVRSINAAKTPNFMVDKAGYIFGMADKKTTETHHQAFKDLISLVCEDTQDDGVVAVRNFLAKWEPAHSVSLDYWDEISGTHGKRVAFRLDGDTGFIHERSEVKKLWKKFVDKAEYTNGICFTDGQEHRIQDQYAQFPLGGGTGTSLVSFNKGAFESYGKIRGANAPISIEAEFKSSTALKYLLSSKNGHRLLIGDTTMLFWTEKKNPVEVSVRGIFDPPDDGETADAVRQFIQAMRKGKLPNDVEAEDLFYILGISVNSARLALRYWYVCSVRELMQRLSEHFECLEMEKSSERDIPYPGIWHLLKETARETKNISPVLGGALMRAILTGGNYPQNLYHGVLLRIRADRRVNYLRASILKAVLQRNHNKEISMSLDVTREEPAYLLGRLFAVLEKAQLDALGKVNTTIKDRFFSAASATPASVFPRLMRLSQYHMEKSEYGYISDMRIAEIMEHIGEFPIHLGLQEQGLFAIAYYHQKNALYAKKNTQGENNE